MKESPKRTIEDREADYARDAIRYSLEGATKNMTPRPKTRKMTSLKRIERAASNLWLDLYGEDETRFKEIAVQAIVRFALSERSKARRAERKAVATEAAKLVCEGCRWGRHELNIAGPCRAKEILALSNAGRGKR